MREQLIAGAMTVWDEPDLTSRSQQLLSASKTRLHPTSTLLSAESLQRTYQDLFSFPFPNKVVSDLGACPSTQSPAFSPSRNISPTQTFILLVQALHNNAVRCWADVRNGSLAHVSNKKDIDCLKLPCEITWSARSISPFTMYE